MLQTFLSINLLTQTSLKEVNILVVCKAGIRIGLGHFYRSKALVEIFIDNGFHDVSFVLIGNKNYYIEDSSQPIKYTYLKDERSFSFTETYDFIFLDALEISDSLFASFRKKSKTIISISPIFNQLSNVDALIHRTKYIPNNNIPDSVQIFAGLKYSIVRKQCHKISPSLYQENLKSDIPSIAISMGGTDAANITLKILQCIKSIETPFVIWILLGDGYEHSYELLAKEIANCTTHEFLLVRSNRSIWKILERCTLAILAGGVTSYEAAYCGLPAINILRDKSRYYLVKELEEEKLCLATCFEIKDLPKLLLRYVFDRKRLIQINSQGFELGKNEVIKLLQTL